MVVQLTLLKVQTIWCARQKQGNVELGETLLSAQPPETEAAAFSGSEQRQTVPSAL